MKVTVNINCIPTEIELTPEQVASIEAQRKPKFKWEYNEPYFLSSDIIRNRISMQDCYLEHGRYRKTKEAAEQSLARNRRANRLEALAEQLGGLEEWSENKMLSWLLKPYITAPWEIITSYNATISPERVYMTKECATEISRMLNAEEFSLDGELE